MLAGTGRSQHYSRRTRSQRATVLAVVLAIQVLTWVLTDSWAVRIAVALLTAIATPALTTLTLDRGSR